MIKMLYFKSLIIDFIKLVCLYDKDNVSCLILLVVEYMYCYYLIFFKLKWEGILKLIEEIWIRVYLKIVMKIY